MLLLVSTSQIRQSLADGQLLVLMELGLGLMEVSFSRHFCISNSQVEGSSGEEAI
jgi:hypothetical protein